MRYPRPIVDWFRKPTADHQADVLLVFVHGFLAAGAFWRPLRVELRTRLHADVFAPSYGPHEGFAEVAERLKRGVRLRHQGRKLVWVGHSLGGLLCRHLAETEGMGGDFLCTLGTPHLGSASAPLLPPILKAALDRSTGIISRLPRVPEMPHLFIAGSKDAIVPVSSAAPLGANTHTAKGRGHNELLFDKGVQRLVTAAISRAVETPRSEWKP